MKFVGTVLTPTLPPAPGPRERTAAAGRRVRKSVAFVYYVTRYAPPAFDVRSRNFVRPSRHLWSRSRRALAD
jgi:hypothetical protein